MHLVWTFKSVRIQEYSVHSLMVSLCKSAIPSNEKNKYDIKCISLPSALLSRLTFGIIIFLLVPTIFSHSPR